MANSQRKQRRLLKLWQDADGKCRWCERQTILIFRGPQVTNGDGGIKKLPKMPNEATIEHLNSKIAGRVQATNNEQLWAMACYECNQERARKEQVALGIDELRRRSRYQQ